MRGGQPEAALAATDLRLTQSESDMLETGWWVLRVGDWFVVVESGWDHIDRVRESHAAELSSHDDDEVIFWTANDSSMAARMACLDNRWTTRLAVAAVDTHEERAERLVESELSFATRLRRPSWPSRAGQES